MAYGLTVKNDNGNIQIDSQYNNYFLYEHNENIDTALDSGIYHKDITFSSSITQPPLIAIKPDSDGFCTMPYLVKSGANYTGFIIYSEYKVVTFSWQAFVPITTKSSETYGLRVYNDSETLVFDSGYRSMVIGSVSSGSPSHTSTTTMTISSDANAYFIGAPICGHWTYIIYTNPPTNGTHIVYLPMIQKDSDTQLTYGGKIVTEQQSPPTVEYNGGIWITPWTIIYVKKAF